MSVCFLSTTNVDGWKIKTYGITRGYGRPRAALVRAACRRAATALPDRPDREGAYGVGFLIVKDGPDRCLALVDWWAHVDELHQRIFAAPTEQPLALAPQSNAAIGGVSELEVTAYERLAWLRHVLDNPSGSDIDAYLADTLHAHH